jgi:HD-like signal output (HDOD) protein/CheY-like chemotaxis protein
LSLILRSEGFRVHAASSVAQAKEMIAKRAPDVLVCEMVLPDGSVLGLLRSLREHASTRSIRVCVLTNVAAKTPLTQAAEAGVQGVMLKARFTLAGLLNQIQSRASNAESTRASDQGEEDQARFSLPIGAPDPALGLRQLKPMLTRVEMEQRLKEIERIPIDPSIAARVRAELDADACGMESIASAIEADPGLTSRVLCAACAQGDGCEEPVRSVFDAVLRVGLDGIQALLDEMPDDNAPIASQQVALDQLRAHAIGVGILSRRIAKIMSDTDPRDAYLAGLLHDIGRVRMLLGLGAAMRETESICASLGVDLVAGEKRLLLCEHDKLGMSTCAEWNLSKDVLHAIGYHHEDASKIGSICASSAKTIACVAIADRIAHALGMGHSGSQIIEPMDSMVEVLGTPEITIEQITANIASEVQDSMERVGLDPAMLTDGVVHAVPEHQVSPIYLSMDPERDLIGTWIRAEFGDDTPSIDSNLIVVHARQARERNALSELVSASQKRVRELGGSRPIPVLILSPTGKNGLTEEVMTRHLCMHLRTPFGITMFERACNALLSGKQQLDAPVVELRAAA